MKVNLSSTHYEVDDLLSAQEFYHSRNWTDGLPVVPPTPDAVGACLEWMMMPADQLVGIEPVRQCAITAENVKRFRELRAIEGLVGLLQKQPEEVRFGERRWECAEEGGGGLSLFFATFSFVLPPRLGD